MNKFFQQEGPNAANYILEEFVDGEIVTFDGVADANARRSMPLQPCYAGQHHGDCPRQKADVVLCCTGNQPRTAQMGEAALKAFGAKSRFFHLEFFRLKTAKPSLGNAGDILGLEVNMRPAGGYTVDMLNYAGGLDLYQIWADMVAFGAARTIRWRVTTATAAVRVATMNCATMPHEELLKKYRSCLNAAPRLPEVLAREMGTSCTLPALRTKPPWKSVPPRCPGPPRE